MLIQKLTLICASVTIAVLTACGGANMSGGVSPRKEKTDKSGAKDASAPAVVTGAYLFCDYSPRDNTSEADAVGCSMELNGNKVTPTTQNKLAFYSSKAGGAYKKPDKTNTSSGHQALFLTAKEDFPRTRYLATFANRYGVDEFFCDSVPCTKPVISDPVPTHLLLQVDGIWRADGNIIKFGMDAIKMIRVADYCTSGTPRFGQSPAANFAPIVGAVGAIGGGLNTLERLGQLYAKTDEFRHYQVRENSLLAPLKDYAEGEGCIVVPLQKPKLIKEFFADGMSQSGPKIFDEYFHLILQTSPENISTVKQFIADIKNKKN
jgi:hypothetical protein